MVSHAKACSSSEADFLEPAAEDLRQSPHGPSAVAFGVVAQPRP